MQGATESGGYTIGVLANDLLKASVNRQNRMGLQEGRLVLVSRSIRKRDSMPVMRWHATSISMHLQTERWLLTQPWVVALGKAHWKL
jgi:hypothetical protein